MDNFFTDEEISEILNSVSSSSSTSLCIGNETKKLFSYLRSIDKNSAKKILMESCSIINKSSLSRDFSRNQSKTGIVIGYIQSGKTFSFTTVSCLARDNKFSLVVVIAGTSTNLLNQTTERLRKDLQIDSRTDRSWSIFKNPTLSDDGEHIESTLDSWNDNSIPFEEKTSVLIVVMKHHIHIGNLIEILGALNLSQCPSLVIDDEADQAGLNTQANKGEGDISTTYSRLLDLRQSIPHHTYLQYTATPQAPLLIDIIDRLSPDFAELLVPGDEYTGGREFFDFKQGRLIETIPSEEVPTNNNSIQEPPESLLRAMRIFYLSVAIGLLNRDVGNRSMMVHPSRRTAVHGEYTNWIRRTKENWLRVIQLPNSQDYSELINLFEKSYHDLSRTVSDIPFFTDAVSFLKRSISQTRIHEVNATDGTTPIIDWRGSYSHILIGGQAMDRGYTVEGLTVTYMPRGPGVGNADTIQQRARFYGYKKNYLEYCRIFLENDSRNAFESYIEHENSLRESLFQHIKEGKSLKDWKRVFFLDNSLNPTRQNILATDYRRGLYSNKWFEQRSPHNIDTTSIEHNHNIMKELCNEFEFKPDEGHERRTPMMRHNVVDNIPLEKVLEYLIKYKMSNQDFVDYIGLLLQIKAFFTDNQNEHCTIYIMSKGECRERSINGYSEISQLFQGAAPVSPPNIRGTIYPGDREMKNQNQLTIQIHKLNIKYEGEYCYKNVPTMAIWVPERYGRSWVHQSQNNN